MGFGEGAGGEVDGSVGLGQLVAHHACERRLRLEAAGGRVGEVVGEHLLLPLQHLERGSGAGQPIVLNGTWHVVIGIGCTNSPGEKAMGGPRSLGGGRMS